jgi:hypothetical protein
LDAVTIFFALIQQPEPELSCALLGSRGLWSPISRRRRRDIKNNSIKMKLP